MNSWHPSLRGKCDEACLGLGLDPVPKQTILNVLQRIDRKPIKYDNDFPRNNRALLSEIQIKYVAGIIVKIELENLGI